MMLEKPASLGGHAFPVSVSKGQMIAARSVALAGCQAAADRLMSPALMQHAMMAAQHQR
jgi:hypothetical protein